MFRIYFLNTTCFFKYLGALILYSLIVVVGTILFIVPGIIWGIKFRFFSYFIVEDENCGIIESLERSAQITQESKWNLFLFNIILGFIGLLGFLAFFVGILLAMPVTVMATVFVYYKLKKDKVEVK